jgi:hypothetical protein
VARYYYAGGRRIELETDDEHVAVDEMRARAAGLDAEVERASAGASRLPGGVVLTPRASLDEKRLASLRQADALRPVYRRDRAVVVALPEVRVEFDHPSQRRAVMDALANAPHRVTVSDETKDGLVLQPTSGSSDDALSLANYVYEHARPAAASVRFVQFVPKTRIPDP